MPALVPGAVVADRYIAHRLLGEHAGAESWTGSDGTTGDAVVLVVLPDDHPQALAVLDAAHRARGLDNDRLARILEAGRANGVAFFAEESLDGAHTLGQLAARGGLDADEVRRITGEAALALDAGQVRGLHHLSLTPESLLVMPDGGVKVAGLATQAALAGHDHIGGPRALRRDAQGLVALAYAGLTGRWPHGASTRLEPAPRIFGGVPRPSDIAVGVPADLDTICRQTLSEGLGPSSPADYASQIAPWAGMPGLAQAEAADGATDSNPTVPIDLRPAPVESVTTESSESMETTVPRTVDLTKPDAAKPDAAVVAGASGDDAVAASTASGVTGASDAAGATATGATTAGAAVGAAVSGVAAAAGRLRVWLGMGRNDHTGDESTDSPTEAADTTDTTAAPAQVPATVQVPAEKPDVSESLAPQADTTAEGETENAGGSLVGRLKGLTTATTGRALQEHRTLKQAIRDDEAAREVSIDQTPQQQEYEPPAPLLPAEAGAPPTSAQKGVVLALFAAFVVIAGALGILGASKIGSNTDLGAILGETTPRRSATTSSAPPTADKPGETSPLAISAATGYDPEGGGNENNALAAKVYDEDPNSYWQTEGYQGPGFAGLKSGVGVLLDMGQVVTPTKINLSLPTPSSFEIYLGNEPDKAGATKIGASDGEVKGDVSITTDGATSGQYLIVWFTSAPQVADGSYRATLGEISVFG